MFLVTGFFFNVSDLNIFFSKSSDPCTAALNVVLVILVCNSSSICLTTVMAIVETGLSQFI